MPNAMPAAAGFCWTRPLGAVLAVLLSGALAWADAPDVRRDLLQPLAGSSITLGAGYLQGTFKARASNPGLGEAQSTDNGQFNALLDYTGRDKVLVRVPMRVGEFLLGWNLTGSLGQFKTDRQLLNSAFTGTDVGTEITGQFAAVAPSLFMRLGPLYPGTRIYWSFGAALGAGATHYTGTAEYPGSPGTKTPVGGSGVKAALFEAAFWQLDVGHWVLRFNGRYFLIRDPDLASASFEAYGLSLGYRISF